MDIEQFRQSLTDPKRTKEELLTMRENALRKGREFASVAEEVLEQRFPGWNRVKSRHGGATPVDVTFLAQGHHFDTAKEAYIWLIERFIHKYPKPFIDLDWETVFLAKGPRALFFAKSVRKLFGERQHLADDPNKYHRLTNGWFAKLVLSNRQKLEILLKFASLAQLKFGKDWDWNALGQRYEHVDVEQLLSDLENEP